ncbi:MAG: hypothetical protein IJS52_10375 [Bacilli bacterium]|nr:hypothetical protein [Bacilli bacterium]
MARKLLSISLSGTYRTSFGVGEYFDASGVVVTAHYSGGSSAQVTNYVYGPHSVLTESVSEVSFYYSEAGVTKSASIAIVVSGAFVRSISASLFPDAVLYEGALAEECIKVSAVLFNGWTVTLGAGSCSFSSPRLPRGQTVVLVTYQDATQPREAAVTLTVPALPYAVPPGVGPWSARSMFASVPVPLLGEVPAPVPLSVGLVFMQPAFPFLSALVPGLPEGWKLAPVEALDAVGERYLDEDGRVWPLKEIAGGSGSLLAPGLGAILREAPCGHELTFPDGSVKAFDVAGRLASVSHYGGASSMQLSYDVAGRLSCLSSGGSSVSFQYGAGGLLESAAVTCPGDAQQAAVIAVLYQDGLLVGADLSQDALLRIQYEGGLPSAIARPGASETIRLGYTSSLCRGLRLRSLESGVEDGAGAFDQSALQRALRCASRDEGSMLSSLDWKNARGVKTRVFFGLDGLPASSFEPRDGGLLSLSPNPGFPLELGGDSSDVCVNGSPAKSGALHAIDMSGALAALGDSASAGTLTASLRLFVRLSAVSPRPRATISYRGQEAAVDLDRMAVGCFVPVEILLPADLDAEAGTATLLLPQGCDAADAVLSPGAREAVCLGFSAGLYIAVASVLSVSSGGVSSGLAIRGQDMVATLRSLARGVPVLFLDSMRSALPLSESVSLSFPGGGMSGPAASLALKSTDLVRCATASDPEEARRESVLSLSDGSVLEEFNEVRPAGAMYPTALFRSGSRREDGYGRELSRACSPLSSDPSCPTGLHATVATSYDQLGLPSCEAATCDGTTTTRSVTRDSSGRPTLSQALGGYLATEYDYLGRPTRYEFTFSDPAATPESVRLQRDALGRPTSVSFLPGLSQVPLLEQRAAYDGHGGVSLLRGGSAGIAMEASPSAFLASDWPGPGMLSATVTRTQSEDGGALVSLSTPDSDEPGCEIFERRVRSDAYGRRLSVFVVTDETHDEGYSFAYAACKESPSCAPRDGTRDMDAFPNYAGLSEWSVCRDGFGAFRSARFLHAINGLTARASYASNRMGGTLYLPFCAVPFNDLGPTPPASVSSPIAVFRRGSDDVEYSLGPDAGLATAVWPFSAFHSRDGLGRLRTVWSSCFGNAKDEFDYGGDGFISSHAYSHSALIGMTSGRSYTESYLRDAKGRLTRAERLESEATTRVWELSYDAAGRLVLELLGTGGQATRRRAFSYNADGALSAESDPGGDFSREYAYGAGNRLARVTEGDNEVASFTYDSLGRRATLTMSGQPEARYSYRLGALRSVTWGSGVTERTVELRHSSDGHVVSKVRSGAWPGGGTATIEYFWDGGRLVAIREAMQSSQTLYCAFYYDELGPAGMSVSLGSEPGSASHFRFLRNPLGDVEGLVDQYGETVAEYEYDAWGLPLGTVPSAPYPAAGHARRLNPFRYRGYFYDEDLGLYILGGRLYDPRFRQFTSLDSPDCLDILAPGGVNPYVYCFNDPVTYTDHTGHMAVTTIMLLVGIGVGAAIGAATNVVSQYISNGGWDNFSWASLGWNTLIGAASGALAMSTLGAVAMTVANGVLGAIGAVGSHLIAGDDFGAWQTWLDIVLSTGAAALAGGLGGPGAMHGRDFAAASSSLAKAASSYSRVVSKVSSGGYATARGMHVALSRTGNGLFRAMNGMYSLVGGAANDLASSLAATFFVNTGYAFVGGLAAYEW